MDKSCIPIVIGITGHRDLLAGQEMQIRNAVQEQLTGIQKRCPNSEIVVSSSLAAGADMLCAEEALKLGLRLICPLPMAADLYAEDFSAGDKARFYRLLEQAADAFVVEQSSGGRDAAYRECGKYVADHCHILLALWNGETSKSGGVGTAAAVHYAQYGCFPDSQEMKFGSHCGILQVTVGRVSDKAAPTGEVRCVWLNECDDTLRETDQFNRDARLAGSVQPEETKLPQSAKHLQELYQRADSLSVAFQKRYMQSLLAMAVYCVLLVLSYLMYDELDCKAFLLVYGGIMAVYGFSYLWLNRSSFLEKYLNYRMLAEAARVQMYMSSIGSRENVVSRNTWTQKKDTAWISAAVSVMLLGPAEETVLSPDYLREAWIHDQLNYHRRSIKKTDRKLKISSRVSNGTLLALIGSFFLVLILEYWFPDFMVGTVWLTLLPQGWLKILWGTITAVTLFVSSYLGKLSLVRRSIDHEKMQQLFQTAEDCYDRFPQKRMQLFRLLAREELIENGNWYSYSRENTPSFDL